MLHVTIFLPDIFFSAFHFNRFCTKVEPDIELKPSNHESVRRKMFQNFALFLISNQFWAPENLKPLSVLNIASKNRNKTNACSPFFSISKLAFCPLHFFFYISFKLLGHRNPDSLIALGLEELGDIEV